MIFEIQGIPKKWCFTNPGVLKRYEKRNACVWAFQRTAQLFSRNPWGCDSAHGWILCTGELGAPPAGLLGFWDAMAWKAQERNIRDRAQWGFWNGILIPYGVGIPVLTVLIPKYATSYWHNQHTSGLLIVLIKEVEAWLGHVPRGFVVRHVECESHLSKLAGPPIHASLQQNRLVHWILEAFKVMSRMNYLGPSSHPFSWYSPS